MYLEPLPMDAGLCYVNGDTYLACFFTTQILTAQWGDDWNDCPYWCNAGEPYRPHADSMDDWQIVTILVRGPDRTGTNHHSVQEINAHAVPWLTDWQGHRVWAGTSVREFIKRAREYGWDTYFRIPLDNVDEPFPIIFTQLCHCSR